MKKNRLSILLVITLLWSVFGGSLAASAQEVDLNQLNPEIVNQYLNEMSDLGEGSIANPVAIIPIQHIDGPKNESDFYAFVNFKYVSRDFIKYQVTYVSCTCRESSVNYWTTAYIELSLPESGLLDDSEIVFLSYDQDSTGHYTAGFWGDSSPIPNGTTYEDIKTEYIPYFVGKTYGQLKDYSTIDDIALEDYQAGEGREAYEIDALTGASVSSNNIIRMIQAIFKHHGTDPYFANDPSLVAEAEEGQEVAEEEVAEEEVATEGGETVALLDLPPSTQEEGNYSVEMSTINSTNLIDYLGRTDVLYIDVRDYGDYAKKHLRNFESIPYFAFIWNAEAHTSEEMIQLYGGEEADPIPAYEESDKILEVLFPKDKTIFLMCQSGGRVENLMKILEARGWDMSKIYNIGGMAQYTGSEYRGLTTDVPEFTIEVNYSLEGLTPVEAAE